MSSNNANPNHDVVNSPNTLGNTLLIGVCVAMPAIVLFGILRTKYKFFFMPKSFQYEEEPRPALLSNFFEAIKYTFTYREDDIQTTAGMDAVVYLRFLKYTIYLFAALTAVSYAILVPVNTAGKRLNGLDRLSVSNLEDGSPYLWFHLVSVFINTGLVWYYMYKIYETYVDLTNSHKAKDSLQSRTVMVTHLPKSIKNDEGLLQYFRTMYGKSAIFATVVPYLKKLQALKERRDQCAKDYRRAKDIFLESGKKNVKYVVDIENTTLHRFLAKTWGSLAPEALHPIFCCFGGTKVTAVDYYEKKLKELDEKIVSAQKVHFEGGGSHTNTYIGFVTFDSTLTAMLCSQALHHKNPMQVVVRPAPDPKDIQWSCTSYRKEERVVRRVLTWVAEGLLFLFWAIPITFISAYTNLEALAKVQGLSFLVSLAEQNSTIRGVLDGFLSSLALLIFMAILPYLLRWIVTWHGLLVIREQEVELLRAYWAFLLLNVFLIYSITGSIFAILPKIIKEPETLVELLAITLPQQALPFTNYIIVQTFVSYSLFFLTRLPDFLLCKLKHWFVSTTAIEKHEAELPDPYYFDYAVQYARELLVICMGLTYSTISPIILPFSLFFFMSAWYSAKHNFIYVHTPRYEGVRMTVTVIDCVFSSLMLHHVTTLGVLGLQKFAYGSFILLAMVASLLFRIWLNARFRVPSKYLALENCVSKVDSDVSLLDLQSKHPYLHPALKPLEPVDADPLGSLIIEDPNLDLTTM